jgi:hypothetical protein
VEQDVEAQDEQPDFPPAKTDINFSLLWEPHFGQAIFFSSADEKISSSKIFLHFLHRNSKIGIVGPSSPCFE